ncbi:NlpC/P60 family protein [Sporosarcina sp. 179-K 3D1 HS]|uniref:C40 family peptidase n=1 Tax=Sporosarcina sp. 179-K 3D1 HS TaxID=3232169 RepID=UPI0039A3CBDD
MKKKAFSLLVSATLATLIATGSVQAATDTHTVKSGDTLWKIASQHKLTVDELKSMNNLTSDAIKVNQTLIISPKLTTAKKSTTPAKPAVQQNVSVGQAVSKEKTATSSINSWAKANDKATSPKVNEPKPVPKSPVAKPTAPSNGILATAVDVSLPLLDTPYVWAGVTEEGFDCSGFIYYVFNKAGLALPRLDTIGMFNHSSEVTDPVPGDLLFFENTYREGISHAGIYLGDGKFIHAGTKKVEISSVDYPYWQEKFVGYKRFNQIK